MSKFRFHVLGLPHTVTSKEYNACAYTQKAYKFCKMMTDRGHEVIHYGHEESDPQCTEHVTVTTNEDLKIAYGNYDWRKNFFKFDTGDHAYQTFYKNAIREVGIRKRPNDFILPFWGAGVRPVCDAHPDIICVEPGIGYAGGHWARFKIFESYAIYNAWLGLGSVGSCQQDWYHAVIPNYFDPDDFTYCEKKEDYFLCLGRVYEGKGVHIAEQVTREIGAKLIIAGQSSLKEMGYQETPPHVTEMGYANALLRRKLMSNAKGAFILSQYNEPFGGVQIEMLFSGTPTITTDWGAFAENNLHGITGYRCRTFEQMLWAARNIDRIDPKNCRSWAENFTMEKVASMYEEYFQSVYNVYIGQGWYERKEDRAELDWLKKDYPKLPERLNFEHMNYEETPFAKRLASWIKEKLDPTNVLDIGCGPGIFVYPLRDIGVDARGVDVDERVRNKPHLEYKSLFDLNNDAYEITTDTAHTVICLEVAEHIEKEKADEVVRKVANSVGKYLIWTAARPGQGGIGHINCQEKEYWAEKLEKQGLVRNKEKEEELLEYCKQGVYMGWFLSNLLFFERIDT